MENQTPLKIGISYDANSRTKFIDAVEWAGERMVVCLRNYVEIYERGPETIIIKSERYSPFLCLSRLQREVEELGLTSKLGFSSNGESEGLVFNLDAIADSYFQEGLDRDEIFR